MKKESTSTKSTKSTTKNKINMDTIKTLAAGLALASKLTTN